jgi:TRAP-type C4-dicarboxylate transport system substrate-binding protein
VRREAVLRLLLALIAVGCVAGVLAARKERPEHTIRVAFLAGVDDEDYIGARAFEQRVEADTGGRVDVQVFPSGQFCGSERECIEALQSGILDVHMTTFGGLATLFGAAQVLDLPYTFAGDAAAECVMDGSFMEQLRMALLEAGLGLRLMAVGNTGGWRSFGTTGQSIRSVGDFQGLRIRTLPSALEQEMVRRIGGSPTPLPFSEVYTALSYGLLDGTKLSPQDLVGQKLHEHAKYLLLDRHAYMGALWWYSEPAWRVLPDELRPAVEAGFDDLKRATRAAAKSREAPALAEFRRSGGVVEEPAAGLRMELGRATRELRDWYSGRYGDEWLLRLDAAVVDCAARR